MKSRFKGRAYWMMGAALVCSSLAVAIGLKYQARHGAVKQAQTATNQVDDLSGWHEVPIDPWNELGKLTNSLQEMAPFRAAGHIDLLANENNKLLESQHFSSEYLDSTRSKIEIAHNVIVADRGYLLTVNCDEKALLVQKGEPGTSSTSPLEKLKAYFDRDKDTLHVYEDQNGKRMLYAPGFASGGMSNLKIIYDTGVQKIERVVMLQLNPGKRPAGQLESQAQGPENQAPEAYYVNRIEFVYDRLEKEREVPQAPLYAPFINISGKEVSLTDSTSQYKLVNAISSETSK